ncbi:hypothetical protein PviCFBP13507_20015 [Pseudomonas viridiflava]|nr:hypothetical protein PviCFBP13507_20015 [Pseudomonas viridiflava]
MGKNRPLGQVLRPGADKRQAGQEDTISADSLVLHTTVQGGIMKKIAVAGLIALLSIVSVSASACPKGTHPTGGTGSHHKGGTCK